MANAKRPPLMGSKIARRTLEGRQEREFHRLFELMDTIDRHYEALDTLHKTPNPNLTKEASAARYGEQYRKAHKMLGNMSVELSNDLASLESRLKSEAETKAGLNKPMTEAAQQEIRAALRSMPQKERDKTLREAALNGDVGILKSVREASTPFLYGGTSEPVESLIQQHMERAVPNLRSDLEAIEHANSHLKMSVDGFVRETEKMRDPILESSAEAQQESIRQAEAVLSQGVQSNGD